MRNRFLFDGLHGETTTPYDESEVGLEIFTTMLYGDIVPRIDGLMSSSFTTLERVSLALSLFM